MLTLRFHGYSHRVLYTVLLGKALFLGENGPGTIGGRKKQGVDQSALEAKMHYSSGQNKLYVRCGLSHAGAVFGGEEIATKLVTTIHQSESPRQGIAVSCSWADLFPK